jgi:hypothetical protein
MIRQKRWQSTNGKPGLAAAYKHTALILTYAMKRIATLAFFTLCATSRLLSQWDIGINTQFGQVAELSERELVLIQEEPFQDGRFRRSEPIGPHPSVFWESVTGAISPARLSDVTAGCNVYYWGLTGGFPPAVRLNIVESFNGFVRNVTPETIEVQTEDPKAPWTGTHAIAVFALDENTAVIYEFRKGTLSDLAKCQGQFVYVEVKAGKTAKSVLVEQRLNVTVTSVDPDRLQYKYTTHLENTASARQPTETSKEPVWHADSALAQQILKRGLCDPGEEQSGLQLSNLTPDQRIVVRKSGNTVLLTDD